MSNPALKNNPAFSGKALSPEQLQRIYDMPAGGQQRTINYQSAPAATQQAAPQQAQPAQTLPSAQAAPGTPVMTYENTISKTVLLFVVILITGAIGWMLPLLAIPAAITALVLGLVNSFKKQPSVTLIVLYAAAEGIFLGGISGIFEAQLPGIVSQAVIGTLSVFAVTLLLFRSGKVRTSPKLNKIFLIAMGGYLLFSLINFVTMITGLNPNPWGMRSGVIGLAIGALAVLLAAYSLVMDFESIQNGVRNRVPEKWAWAAAFGLTVTLVWLYLEILRIIAIFRD